MLESINYLPVNMRGIFGSFIAFKIRTKDKKLT